MLDEPATAQALAAFLLRGVHCGAIAVGEIKVLTGSDLDTVTRLASRARLILSSVLSTSWLTRASSSASIQPID